MKSIFLGILILSGVVYSQTATVTSLGPEGGIVTHLEGSLNDDVILAVVREHDIYRSFDGGESWNSVYVFEFDTNHVDIFDIAFHPVSSDTVLLSTSFGLYRSNDKGQTWFAVQGFPTPKFSIKYAPSNPSILFGSDEMGVLRSFDAGVTWEPLNEGDRPILRVDIHPGDNILSSLRVVATTGFNDTTAVLFSSDGGTTWKQQTDGLPLGEARKIYFVAMDSTGLGRTNYRIVIGTGDGVFGMQSDQNNSVWQPIKINGGQIHDVVTDGIIVFDKYDSISNQYTFAFYAASNSSSYDGNPKPYSSTNGVFRVSSPLIGLFPPPVARVFKDVCDIVELFVPAKSDKQKIYLGTTDGIYISTDGGANWSQKNAGISRRIIRNVVSVPSAIGPSLLFASMFGGGVYRSTDDGSTWAPSNNGLTHPYVTTVVADHKQNLIYAGSAYAIYRSSNYGNSWITLDTPRVINPGRFSARDNDMTIRVSPKNSKLIMYYSPACGLNVTTDGGMKWDYRKPPPGFDSIHVPENIEFDPVNDSTIYFTGFGIFKSTNLGTTWDINLTKNLPTTGFEMLSPTINPFNNKEIFLPVIYSQQDGQPFNLFKTVDGGLTWIPMAQQIPVYDVEYDRFDTKRVIAGGGNSIFRTIDGGATWEKLSDPTFPVPYYLLDGHATDANIFFVGSENGAHKVELPDRSKLTIDTVEYHFGNLQLGRDTVRTIYLRNDAGARNVVVQFLDLTDTLSFKYFGPSTFNIAAGGLAPFEIRFTPKFAGESKALLRFRSSDPLLDSFYIVLRGHSFERYSLEKFSYNFGSVTVGQDSTVSVTIDNKFGLDAIKLHYIGNSDTISFHYEGTDTVRIDTGKTVSLVVKFTPKSTGIKHAYIGFTTTDPRFDTVVLRFQGTGVAKNLKTRRVLFENVGFIASDSTTQYDYFKLWILSLRRADIAVDTVKTVSFSQYNSAVYVQPDGPPPQDVIDSLQKFVLNGGTLVALGNYGNESSSAFNVFLHDTTWKKYNVKTGIQFNTDRIADLSIKDSSLGGFVAAYPASKNILNYNVDSVVLFESGSLRIDTTVSNVIPLLAASSKNLVSVTPIDTNKISNAVIAAYSQIGKGKVIVIADYDIWWNGYIGDTTKPFGIFGGNNLQFAFNIFGLIDNLLARLPEPTPQEAYKLISIPYRFADSSVLALFKDLGPPNELVWRMFGKWSDKKGVYGEFPNDFKMIRRGEGYWLITKQPMTINFGTTDVQGVEEDFEIVLQPGYTMIGNPFPYEVSWANSFKEDSVEHVLWAYNGKFDSTSTVMKPFQGYFIKNRGTTSKIIKINSAQVTSVSSLPKGNSEMQLDPQEWKVQISASSKKYSDERNYIGMLKTSVNGFDAEDFSEPPTAPTDYVSLSIRNNGERLAADFRSISNEGQYWDMNVTSSLSNVPINLSFNTFGMLPPNFKIYLLDRAKERVVDVTLSLAHSLLLEKKEYSRELRIIVGTEQYVEANTDGIPIIPLEYSLSQNYPNPFNPTTSIRYSISNSARVKLDIYNTLGQRIKTLVQEFQPIGTYLVEWDGTDNSKKTVATGVYYYRLQANNFTNVKKMTLIK